MKSTDQQQNPPSPNIFSKGSSQSYLIVYQTCCVEGSQYCSDDKLSIATSKEKYNWFGNSGEDEGTDESSWYGTREGGVVVRGETREGVSEDVVGCLEVEGFFYFGVGG